jgi:phosphopantetheinyl transferase (holo-ACP synthase)
MVGNDVVDLADAETRVENLHPRFDRRVFSPQERAVLAAAEDSHRLRWMLWAAKESAFKVMRKLDDRTVFAPARFAVSLSSDTSGTTAGWVCHAGRRVHVRIVERDEVVHAIASDRIDGRDSLLYAVARLFAESPSAGARRLALAAIAPRLGVPARALSITSRRRVPQVQRGGEAIPVDLSLSHHGRFAAFACSLRELEQAA